MKMNNRSQLVAPLCLGLMIVVFTLGATSRPAGITPEQQLVEELQKTNQLLAEMNKTLMAIKTPNEMLAKMDKTLTTIQQDLNNSKNNICIKEHLEDIKSLLKK